MRLNTKSALFTVSVIAALCLGFAAMLAYYTVPTFQETFQNFEMDVPFKTQVVLLSYKYWVFLPLIPLFISVQVCRRKQISDNFSKLAGYISVGALVFAWLLISFTVSAMYEPIYGI